MTRLLVKSAYDIKYNLHGLNSWPYNWDGHWRGWSRIEGPLNCTTYIMLDKAQL